MTPEELSKRLDPKRWTKHQRRAADNTVKRVKQALVEETPRKTGTLINSLQVTHKDDGGSTFRFTAPYAGWVVNGTPPHIIEASNAQALHWTIGGGDFFAKSVNHPGTQPNDFISRARDKATPQAEAELAQAGGRFFAEVVGN